MAEPNDTLLLAVPTRILTNYYLFPVFATVFRDDPDLLQLVINIIWMIMDLNPTACAG